MIRPKLNKNISLKDFSDFYWLKKELVSFCKDNKIDYSGGKIEITERIIYFLKTGKKPEKVKSNFPKSDSNFDWNNETLTFETIITDNYRNTENLRSFFISKIGKHFKFNVLFMNWMKQNVGKTLKDAVDEWEKIYLLKKDVNYKSEIDSQFEYNAYVRDFLKDNPNMSLADARKYWNIKRETRGNKKYTKEDLMLG
jgi:hypothetical protein